MTLNPLNPSVPSSLDDPATALYERTNALERRMEAQEKAGGLGVPTPVNGQWLTAAGGAMLWSPLPAPALPARLGGSAANMEGGQAPNDWNQIAESGWYMSSSAANAPVGGTWLIGYVLMHTGDWLSQTVWVFTDDPYWEHRGWRRQKNAGGWSSWYPMYPMHDDYDGYEDVGGAGSPAHTGSTRPYIIVPATGYYEVSFGCHFLHWGSGQKHCAAWTGAQGTMSGQRITATERGGSMSRTFRVALTGGIGLHHVYWSDDGAGCPVERRWIKCTKLGAF